MNISEINHNHEKVIKLVSNKQLKDAFTLINKTLNSFPNADLRSQLNKNKNTYLNMIRFTIEGTPDPKRKDIYEKLVNSTLNLADLAKQFALANSPEMTLMAPKKDFINSANFSRDEAKRIVDQFIINKELQELLESSAVGLSEDQITKREEIDLQLSQIFNRIWLTDKYQEADIELVTNICNSKDFPWYYKSIMVSALTLSLFSCFDIEKIKLLIQFVGKKENEVWQRSLVGLILGLYIHNDRLEHYPEVYESLKRIHQLEVESVVEGIVLQIIKSKDTERITKKFEQEIMPEILKKGPQIKDKLKLDDILSKNPFEDKNPDWEKYFEDSEGLYKKVEEFSKMQMDGSDVFMSTFSKLKHFSFFRSLSNWFLPFHKDNKRITETIDNNPEVSKRLVESISAASFICNSDKYSFLLNIKNLPQEHKDMMVNLFESEMNSMKELEDEEKMLEKDSNDRAIYTQYIQDLYRFYKLFPQKSQFKDIFSYKLDIYNTKYFSILVDNKEILRRIGEFYFDRDLYEDAAGIYHILENSGENDYEILQKTAFCYQKLRQYETALDYYLKAELHDKNKSWNIKKIAYCYRRLEKHDKALEYYQEAEKLEPDNLYIQASLGHSYLGLEDYDKALEYYFKVEYHSPSNTKIVRPIAWCYLMQSKYEDALNYFSKIPDEEQTMFDLINTGHIHWFSSNRKEAVAAYKRSIEKGDNNVTLFLKTLIGDKKLLISKGIDSDEIPLMLDYVRYEVR